MDDAVQLELLTIGRVSVDLYAEQLGVAIRHVRTFRKSVGGTATNVAVAAARLGHRAAVVTKVGDDAFGDYVRWALADTFGVDTRFVGVHPTLRTPLAFAEMDPPDDPRIIFYREPAAPDLSIERRDVHADVAATVPILWVSAGALAAEPSRSTVHELLPRGAAARRRSSTSTGDRSSGTRQRARLANCTRHSRTRRSPSATAPSARSPSARPTPTRPPTGCSLAA